MDPWVGEGSKSARLNEWGIITVLRTMLESGQLATPRLGFSSSLFGIKYNRALGWNMSHIIRRKNIFQEHAFMVNRDTNHNQASSLAWSLSEWSCLSHSSIVERGGRSWERRWLNGLYRVSNSQLNLSSNLIPYSERSPLVRQSHRQQCVNQDACAW